MSKMTIGKLDLKTRIRLLIVSIILLIGLLWRVVYLDTNPAELFSDELINFTSARSIVYNGVDLEGTFGVYFSDRVEMRPPIYGYSTLFTSMFFGDSVWAIRLPAAMYGVLGIFLLIVFVREMTGSTDKGMAAGFVLAILPWHIHYSRVGWEPASFIPFLLCGLWLMVRGFARESRAHLVGGVIVLALSVYTYHTAFMYTFLLLAMLLLLNIRYVMKHIGFAVLCLGIYLLVLSPFFYTAATEPHMTDRARRIMTFKDGYTEESMHVFLNNYMAHFDPRFFFLTGDSNLRHGAQTGMLHLWMWPLLLVGLYSVVRSNNTTASVLFLWWLVIFPLAGALSDDGVPHASRTLMGAPLFAALTGVGIIAVDQFLRKRKLQFVRIGYFVVLGCSVCISAVFFAQRYFVDYPLRSAHWWSYGNSEVFRLVQQYAPGHERVCMGNFTYWDTLPLLAYYWPERSIVVIEDVRNDACRETGTLLVTRVGEAPSAGAPLDRVKDVYGNDLYYLYSI